MSSLLLKEISIESPSCAEDPLEGINHMTLELKLNDKVVKTVKLLSHGSNVRIWDTNEPLFLRDADAHYIVSAIIGVGNEEKKLVGSMTLHGSELSANRDVQFEKLLVADRGYPNLTLKAKVGAMAVEGLHTLVSDVGQQNGEEAARFNNQNQGIVDHPRDSQPDDRLESPEQRISRICLGTQMPLEDVVNWLNNLGSRSLDRFKHSGNLEDVDNAITHHQVAVEILPDGHPDKPSLLGNLGCSLRVRFQHTGNFEDLDNAISRQKAAVSLIPDGHPNKPGLLSNLGNSLHVRFEQLAKPEDLENSIVQKEISVYLTPDGHPDKPSLCGNLGISLYVRFKHFGNTDDLTSAIKHLQAAANLTPDGHPSKSNWLNNLGISFQIRFECFGNLEDIEKSIAALQESVDLTSNNHSDKPGRLMNLGNSLELRFRCLRMTEDIDSAVIQQQTAVNIIQDGHPDKASQLFNLGISLVSRFQRFGNLSDVDSAIVLQQQAVSLIPDSHPDKPNWLSNLGSSLEIRFKRLNKVEDIDTAILQQQAAVHLTPDGHPNKPNWLSNLGNSLQTRFHRMGDLDDINEAILRHQEAVTLILTGHADKSSLLNNLGNSLLVRFERLGDLGDIDNSIAQLQAAVVLTPDGHPNKPNWLSNLGAALRTRSQRLGTTGDIGRAIIQLQAAVQLTPNDLPDKPSRLTNLGNCFEFRFQRLGHARDIHNAVDQLKVALDLTPDDHPNKPSRLTNLGCFLRARFECLGSIDDINDAINHQQAAVDLTPHGHPDKPDWLTNLGNSLGSRFEHFGNVDDIDEAITKQKLAIDLSPEAHPRRLRYLNNLGTAFLTRFLRLHYLYDAEASISHLSAAAVSPVGSPLDRFTAVRSWIRVASMVKHPSLLAAYECAIDTIPLVVWLGLSINDRHQHLVRIGAMVRDAAATAISLRHYDKAIEWLEQGRSVVWTQILHLRTPLDRLCDVDSKLAARLRYVSQSLDSGVQQYDPKNEEKLSPEEEGRRYRALAEEWGMLIKRVQSLPDLQGFMSFPKLSQLMDATNNGPVIILNSAEERCDALLLRRANETVHVPLPNLTLKKTKQLQADLGAILKSSNLRLRAIRVPGFEGGDDEECRRILAELWHCLVKPVLDALSFSPHPNTLPRIWWCVTGPLAFLPIHAAGIYDEGSPNDQIHNYTISSYIPTLSVLLESSKATLGRPFRMLSVIEPSTGRWYIPNTRQELEYIRRQLKDRDHDVLEGPDATKERVTNAMKNCNWLHLACHGSQNARNPTKSALKLRGGDLQLEEIIKLYLPMAEFAFLSACQTVAGEETLPEEAVHLAGGMLLAGYQSIVATMWSIEDKLAPEVADEFYRHVMEDGARPDSRKAAEALHRSVQKLRNKSGIPMVSWIPFVHLGI